MATDLKTRRSSPPLILFIFDERTTGKSHKTITKSIGLKRRRKGQTRKDMHQERRQPRWKPRNFPRLQLHSVCSDYAGCENICLSNLKPRLKTNVVQNKSSITAKFVITNHHKRPHPQQRCTKHGIFIINSVAMIYCMPNNSCHVRHELHRET